MDDALKKDQASNRDKKPAIKRLILLPKIDATLRRIASHDHFITNEGLDRLYNWLIAMPDDTYPNPKIVLCILQQLDRLELKSEDLEQSAHIEDALKLYSAGIEGSSGYGESADLARTIMNKWNRTKLAKPGGYDEKTDFDQGWQALKRQLDDAKEKAGANSRLTKRQRLGDDGAEEQKQMSNAALMSENERSKHANFAQRSEMNSGLQEAEEAGSGKSKNE